jgi:hypothetical protein
VTRDDDKIMDKGCPSCHFHSFHHFTLLNNPLTLSLSLPPASTATITCCILKTLCLFYCRNNQFHAHHQNMPSSSFRSYTNSIYLLQTSDLAIVHESLSCQLSLDRENLKTNCEFIGFCERIQVLSGTCLDCLIM